jgi:molecular chaperone DnaK (HSP70)
VVGIDLGTTNSVVACADTASPGLGIEVVAIPQVVGVRANDA